MLSQEEHMPSHCSIVTIALHKTIVSLLVYFTMQMKVTLIKLYCKYANSLTSVLKGNTLH